MDPAATAQGARRRKRGAALLTRKTARWSPHARGQCGESEIRHTSGQHCERISDSKPHEQSIDSSVVLEFEVPKRGCHADSRNFKFTTLGRVVRNGAIWHA